MTEYLMIWQAWRNKKDMTSHTDFSALNIAPNYSDAETAPPPIFGRSVNPIPTRGDRFCLLFTTGTHNFFHLPASLKYSSSMSWNLSWRNEMRRICKIFFICMEINMKKRTKTKRHLHSSDIELNLLLRQELLPIGILEEFISKSTWQLSIFCVKESKWQGNNAKSEFESLSYTNL